MTPSEDPPIVTTKDSPRSVDETVERLAALIEDRQMTIFAVIDQAAEARKVGLRLRPTTLVIFGSPAAGTAVMEAAPLVAVDLPLKILVWAEGDHTKVSYTGAAALAARYGLDADLAAKLSGIESLADALVAP